MLPSPMGIVISVLLLLIARRLGDARLIGLMLSVPFAATAIGTLVIAGGATPLIYTLFIVLLVIHVSRQRTFYRDLSTLFREDTSAWVALALLVYSIASALIFPRYFAGVAVVPQVSRDAGGLISQPLQPVSGNFTQTAYFVLSILTYFAVRMKLIRGVNYDVILRGMFAAGVMAALLGLLDLGGKLAGLGDILSPIRTAAYAMLTDESSVIGGFYRISGGGAEPSSYAATTLPFLAFAGSYWRNTGRIAPLLLTLLLLALLLLSTSTTAIAGCGVLVAALGLSVLANTVRNRITGSDLLLLGAALTGLTLLLMIFLMSSTVLDAFWQMVYGSIFQKTQSTSAYERGLWNMQSIEAFLATGGLGIGVGTARPSSWLIAVLTQLGVIGSALMVAMLFVVARGLYGRDVSELDPQARVLVNAMRSAGLGSLVGGLITGSSVDPGIVIFLALAVISAVRAGTHPSMAERFARYIPRLHRNPGG